MLKSLSSFSSLVVLVLAALIAHAAFAVEPTKIKVLIVTGGHGFEKEPFFQMFKDNAEIAFTAAEQGKTNAAVYERDDLLSFDVVVLYDMPKSISEQQKQRFLAL